MKHKRLLLITTCLVFVMICVVALRELFSVKDVNVVYSVTSNEVTEEMQSLLEKYKGKSIFLVDEQEIIDEITANRYLKVVSVKKNYPNEIVVNLTQRLEKYYYFNGENTYYFDDEYFVVRASELPETVDFLTEISFSNIDGTALTVDCNLKSVINFPYSFNADVDKIYDCIKNVSSNVKKISFVTTQEEGNYRVRLLMREGVTIEVRKAGDSLTDKLNQAITFYIELEEARKIEGVVIVQRNDNGKITTVHTFND